VWAGLSEGKKTILNTANMFWDGKYNIEGGSSLWSFCLSSLQVAAFQTSSICISVHYCSSVERRDPLGKLSSFQGISLPARLESAICRKALGKNAESEIHYSAPMRFILKNLYVYWPWLEKWYHKIRMFFHSVIVLHPL